MILYYYGCWDLPGHFWHDPSGKVFYDGVGPFGVWVDGYFPPATSARYNAADLDHPYQDERLAALYHTRGWTVLSMWDRSVDSRYACNATFVREGTLSHEEMWHEVQRQYPQIFSRLKAAQA